MQSHNIPVKLDGYQMSNDPAYYVVDHETATHLTSAPVKIARKSGYSLSFTTAASGSPVGIVKIQGCDDEEDILDRADDKLVNWFDVNSLTSAVGSDYVICLEDRNPQYRWLRVVYTRTSGTATITIKLHSKDYSADRV